MGLFFSLFIFILGSAVGSFLNCVIYRLEKEESFLRGRSFCPHCRHQLGWQDLIPLLSFLFLRGRCRYCGQKISLQYPLVELATAASFLLVFILNIQHPAFCILISCFLIVIFVYDLKHYIIPDKVIYPAILLSFIWYAASAIFLDFYTGQEIMNIIYSAFGAAIFFLLIVLVSKGRWMGLGDVKLAFLMGLFLGSPGILTALFLAFFLGAIIGIGLLISGKKQLSSEIPFGPFLVTGTFIALFWGQKIIDWYLNILII